RQRCGKNRSGCRCRQRSGRIRRDQSSARNSHCTSPKSIRRTTMKNKLLGLILTLAPAAYAGTVPLPHSPGAIPSYEQASTHTGSSVKACLRSFGRGTERGFSATAHVIAGTAHVTREGVVDAAKDADHALVRTGHWLAAG